MRNIGFLLLNDKQLCLLHSWDGRIKAYNICIQTKEMKVMVSHECQKKIPWLRNLIVSKRDELYIRIFSDGYFRIFIFPNHSQGPLVHEFYTHRDGEGVHIYRLGERHAEGIELDYTGMCWNEDIREFIDACDSDILNEKGRRMEQDELTDYRKAFLSELEDFEEAGILHEGKFFEKVSSVIFPAKNLYDGRSKEIKPIVLRDLDTYYHRALAEIATGM
jgi:hypothetical protein